MTEKFQPVTGIRGMNDLLPVNSAAWETLESIVRDWLRSYGYRSLRAPVLEHTRLFTRSIGEVTDIVEKEMYTFIDSLNGDSLTLRPEFTAGIARAVIEHNLLHDGPQRVCALGPVFRHERPQRGRYRQFHQIDVEAFGLPGPDIDAELIIMLSRLWRILGLTDIRLELNTLGAPAERAAHRAALIEHLKTHESVLDEEARRRMHTNPLRVLDSKHPDVQQVANSAPRLLDFLGEDSRAHFDGLCSRLSAAGIDFSINPRLVRGLDYYNGTVFEWVTDRLGAQGTVCGGGRYDGLVELLGGKPAPGIGFAIGFERLLDLWLQGNPLLDEAQCDVYVVHAGPPEVQAAAHRLAEDLRDAGLDVILHAGSSSFKSQMKRADQSGASYAAILGNDELLRGEVSLKPLREGFGEGQGAQQGVALAQAADWVVQRLQNFNYQ